MAKKKTKAAEDWRLRKFSGETFCFGGRWSPDRKDYAKKQLRLGGGRVVDKVTAKLDYVVVDTWSSGAVSAAEKRAAGLNQKGGATIQVINQDDLGKMFEPTRDEAVAMLSAGPEGVKHWNDILAAHYPTQILDLSGLTLPGADLRSANLTRLKLDGGNFKNANLQGAFVRDVTQLNLDGAQLQEATLAQVTDCSFKKANLQAVRLGPAEGCDFEDADLSKARVSGLTDCNLKKANCRGIEWYQSQGRQPKQTKPSDFTDADLTGAKLVNVRLPGATFRRAKLKAADLRRAYLSKADLTKADLTGAKLCGANLGQAKVDGANFNDATLFGIKLHRIDCSRAKGLTPPPEYTGALGPNLMQLQTVAGKADQLEVTAEVQIGDAQITITVSGSSNFSWIQWRTQSQAGETEDDIDSDSGRRLFSKAMIYAAGYLTGGVLMPGSVKASGTKSPVKGPALKKLVIAAWCEAFGIPVPSEEDLKKQKKSRESEQKKLRAELLQELAASGGAKKWNARGADTIAVAGHFRKADLSGASLSGVKFSGLDLQSANFEGATLSRSRFRDCKCNRASFKKATLEGANLRGTGFNRASFAEADLTKANLTGCSLTKADFAGANLTAAKLIAANLTGCNLSTAKLDDVVLKGAVFDQHTEFPGGFKLPQEMEWLGKGPNPALPQGPKKKVGSMTIEQFMKQLQGSVDKPKLDKALKMLKADRFQLFTQIEDDSLTGVVKSQTDASLVYSCRLGADGAFACCTQNLNVCGGLRGTLCKHLLVLIVGLARNEAIDVATVHNWVAASKPHKPALDKDIMSETLLRYKGAEAGEIDWRPTETVPEDFYTL